MSEPERIADVALEALRIMHFDLRDRTTLPESVEGLTDVEGTACVAACYRCLMSYFNQPDHAELDRRNDEAKATLLRLATSRMTVAATAPPPPRQETAPSTVDGTLDQWLADARAAGVPAPDHTAWRIGESQFPLVWRNHYVVATLAELPRGVAADLADKGFDVVTFAEQTTWPEAFNRLMKALGTS